MNKILIIEDDQDIACIERDYLEINDFQVTICDDGVTGINEALKGNFDLILLDLMLPGMDGFSVCKKIREKLDIPIIMVTARKEDKDQILGLGLGANDYILKPFEPSILVARVKANLASYARLTSRENTTENTDDHVLFGPLSIYVKDRRAFINDREILLKNKEFELLLFFVKNKEIVLTKEAIYENIWGMESMGDTATVSVHIHRLRDKMKKIAPDIDLIQTVWGVGYRFGISSV